MARLLKVMAICLIAMLAVELVEAQCPSPTTFQSCFRYVGSGGGQPNEACCAVVRDPKWTNECLCNVAKAGYPGVDFKQALALPKKCKRPVPKGTKCNNVEVPS